MRYNELRPGDVFYDNVDKYATLVMSISIDVSVIAVTYLCLFGRVAWGSSKTKEFTYPYDRVIRHGVEIWRST